MPEKKLNDPTAGWTALVCENLRSLNLPPNEREDVIAELAAHLEDLYDEQVRNGVPESEARQKALNETTGSRPLARQIERAKQETIMNARTKQLWLPGLVSLIGAMILMAILIRISMQTHFLGRSPLYMVLLPWLALLPICGALGAYLSRRSGGHGPIQLAAAVFPTIALFVLGTILTLTHLFVPAQPRIWYGTLALLCGVILPSVSLFLGALPFIKESSGRFTSKAAN